MLVAYLRVDSWSQLTKRYSSISPFALNLRTSKHPLYKRLNRFSLIGYWLLWRFEYVTSLVIHWRTTLYGFYTLYLPTTILWCSIHFDFRCIPFPCNLHRVLVRRSNFLLVQSFFAPKTIWRCQELENFMTNKIHVSPVCLHHYLQIWMVSELHATLQYNDFFKNVNIFTKFCHFSYLFYI
jgi:hypothetical protein